MGIDGIEMPLVNVVVGITTKRGMEKKDSHAMA